MMVLCKHDYADFENNGWTCFPNIWKTRSLQTYPWHCRTHVWGWDRVSNCNDSKCNEPRPQAEPNASKSTARKQLKAISLIGSIWPELVMYLNGVCLVCSMSPETLKHMMCSVVALWRWARTSRPKKTNTS